MMDRSIRICCWCQLFVSDKDLPLVSALVAQDGKYDRLLRLLYDDIQKYETEVAVLELYVQLFGSLASACRVMQTLCKT